MAVILEQELPEGVPIGMLDAVADEMGVDDDPPDGLIIHTHFERDGRVHVFDVWETAEDHEKFRESRLMPAMTKVAAASGFELPATQPEASVTTIHRLVRGH